MSSLSTLTISPNFLQNPTRTTTSPLIQLPNLSFKQQVDAPLLKFTFSHSRTTRLNAVAEVTTSVDPSSSRRLYVGNIPRNLTTDELQKIVQEHGAVDKAEVMYDKYSGRSRRFGFVTMKTVEDAAAAAEKLNGTEVGGREIKVNITEKPLPSVDSPLIQLDDSNFVDSPHKVYVGNLAKTVTSESLKSFFSEKGNVLSAKVSRVPGTSKSTGYGFISFSSEEDVEAAISSSNNALLEGQKIRVNKA